MGLVSSHHSSKLVHMLNWFTVQHEAGDRLAKISARLKWTLLFPLGFVCYIKWVLFQEEQIRAYYCERAGGLLSSNL